MQRTLAGVFPGTVQELISNSVADSLNVTQRLSVDNDSTEGAEQQTDRYTKIQELRQMYKGEARWGNVACAGVVNFNRSFQMANGMIASARTEDDRDSETHDLVRDFLDYNNLTEERALDLGTAGELDGQVALRWTWDASAQHVKIYAVPLIETKYRVAFKDGDYTKPTALALYPDQEKQEKVYVPSQFVFIKFRAIPNGTYGIPTPLPCMEDIKNYDKARNDLRKHNHLFAYPTPVIKGKNASRINAISTKLSSTNWQLGTYLVILADEDFKLEEMTGAGKDALLDEMKRYAQVISGVTDVPVQFLGYPDLLSNRSTSTDMFEGPVKRAQATQRTWIGGFEELLEKVGAVYNAKLGTDHDFSTVSIGFPPIRAGNLQDIIQAWLPVFVASGVSHRTFLREIGIADPDKEIEDVIAEAKKKAAETRTAGTELTPDEEEEIEREAEEALRLTVTAA